jgi:hypothetical protein
MYTNDMWLILYLYGVSICTYFPMYSMCLCAQQYESYRVTTKAEFMNVQFR